MRSFRMPYYVPFVCEKCHHEAPYRAGWCICGQPVPRDEKHHDVFRYDVQAQQMRHKQERLMEPTMFPGFLALAWPEMLLFHLNFDAYVATVPEIVRFNLLLLLWPLVVLADLVAFPFTLPFLLHYIYVKRPYRLVQMKADYDKYIMTEAALKNYAWAADCTPQNLNPPTAAAHG